MSGDVMELNADFSKRVAVHAGTMAWKPSPMPGVERRMLDRLGGEVARATTIVRFAPQSAFSPHVHGGGEEYFVLEGVFQDESGDFPAGSYVRNPPTSAHTPASEAGCTIFVKLWQFDSSDRTEVCIRTDVAAFTPEPTRKGVEVLSLHRDDRESVRLERWAPGTRVVLADDGGLELLVLEGSFSEGGEDFINQSWLRLPKGAESSATAGDEGARVWIKRGHLAVDPTQPKVL